MANENVAFGLKPVRMADGSPYSGGVDMYYVPSSNGTALYVGDPVKLAGSADSAGVASIALCAATDTITGAIVGFADATSMSAGYGAASTVRYVLVSHGQDVLYEIQEDGVGGAIAADDIGLNADIIVAAGSTYTKRSGVMLDTSTKQTTATLGLRICGLAQRPDNAIGTNAKVLVSLNDTTESPGTASDGI
jgi:hypothetical protein